MPALNAQAPAVTISNTASFVVLPEQDLMADPRQPNSSVGLQLSTLTGSTLAGAWVIEASNNSKLGGTAKWTDITSSFSPAPAAVVSGASSQFVELLPLIARAIRASFVATSGAGDALAAICAHPAVAAPSSLIGN